MADRLNRHRKIGPQRFEFGSFTWKFTVRGQIGRAMYPLTVEAFFADEECMWLKSILPGGKGFPRLSVQFVVAAAHQVKGVLVEAHPDMPTMFFDPAIHAVPGSTFAAETPTQLV